MQHFTSVDDLSSFKEPGFIDRLFRRAAHLKDFRKSGWGRTGWNAWPQKTLEGRLLITDFYEPSTRTRLSFEAAMNYCGGRVIGTENAAEFSSAKKGESIADNFRVISGYADIIVGRFRHEGEAKMAAEASLVPVINGGDGKGEHPTQALIDLFIINERFDLMGLRRPLVVTFIGDNYHSRTVHSLAKLLSMYTKHIFYLTPMGMQDDDSRFWEVSQHKKYANTEVEATHFVRSVEKNVMESDVVYITRAQTERHDATTRVLPFVFSPEIADKMPERSLILHPLPRNAELPEEVDKNPRAAYFEQAHNGLFVRMALLEELLKGMT